MFLSETTKIMSSMETMAMTFFGAQMEMTYFMEIRALTNIMVERA